MNWSDRFHKLSDADIRTLSALIQIMDTLLAANHKMPLIYVRAYLEVAMRPGMGATAYGASMGVSQPNMSRLLGAIGFRSRHDQALGLVDQAPAPENGREHQCYLTPKGISLMYDIIRRVERASSRDRRD